MKKIIALSVVALAAAAGMNAQVVNRAISLVPAATVDLGAMPALDNLKSYSMQFWVNPSEWSKGAAILSRGKGLNVSLGEEGKLDFTTGDKTLTVASPGLKPGKWSQVTLICKEGKANVIVDSEEAGSGELNALPKSNENVILGGGIDGKLDEVRFWNDALDEDMKTFDYFTNNTLNKWCPMWDNLVAYYKMDQEKCPALVEFKAIETGSDGYNNHGVMSEGVSRVVADNPDMPYLINSAYTNNERFFDRVIPRDQYLLSNDLIVLGVNVYESDGHLETKTPNNHALSATGTQYLADYEGRKGVLAFDGKATTALTLPAATLAESNSYSFETWLYLDEWTPGAYLLKKENSDGSKGLSISLGDDAANPTLVVKVNGQKVTSKPLDLPVGKWNHLMVNATNGGNKTFAFGFFVNGTSYPGDPEKSDGSNVVPQGSADINVTLGSNLKGKMDETVVWNKTWSVSDEKDHQTYVPLPALNRNVKVADMNYVGGYYRYDLADNPGYSSHSQDEWINIMKGAYEGRDGVKFYISVQGTYTPGEVYGDWRNILSDPAKRKRFATDLAEISKNYDGAELDLEWIEKSGQWTDYGLLAEEIRKALPADKEFRISLHNSYTGFPVAKAEFVDGFTFQQYGPQAQHFGFNNFTTNVNNFIKKFDRDKIMTSYSTTTSKGVNGSAVIGVKGACLEQYTPGDQNVDVYSSGKDTWSYMGPMQVYNRAKVTREENLQGIFYWDMGNDNWEGTMAAPVMPKYNLAKYCSYAINANNDLRVDNVTVKHYPSEGVDDPGNTENPDDAAVEEIGSEIPEYVNVYNLNGTIVKRGVRSDEISGNLAPGLYVVPGKKILVK